MTKSASKSAQIRELLSAGMSGSDIAKQVGCSTNLVYVVKRKMKEGGGSGAPRARKLKANTLETGDLGAFLKSVRAMEKERDELRQALRTIHAELAPLVK